MNYGRYQIVKELGKGSMGVVYQAHDPNLDLLVALKVLRHDRITSEDFVRRFLAEAKVLGRLDHPNLVRVYNVDEDGGTVYIAMEFIEGESLNEISQRRKFSPEEIVKLGAEIAEALDYAHQKGIIHRDIKPGNILIRPDGRIKITDFGIAHIEDPLASLKTQAGEILGTPAYMSPEQIMSQPVDGRSDLFSLGIILYELSTGGRPFGGENLAAIFNAITQTNPTDPAKMNPILPKGLSQVIMKCLRKTPDERFQTGKALAEALKSYLMARDSAEGIDFTSKKRHRNVVFFMIIVIILVGIGGGVIYYSLRPKPGSQKTIEKQVKTAPAKSASLKVDSIPNGAQVFVDGNFKGQTPTRLDLPVGKHEVRLTLPDYHDWEAQVQLNEEGETPLFIRLIQIAEKKP